MPLSLMIRTVLLLFCCLSAANGQVDSSAHEGSSSQSYSLPIPITLAEGGPAEPKASSCSEEEVVTPSATKVATAAADSSLLLPPRPTADGATKGQPAEGALGNPLRMLSSLAVVLGVFFVFTWFVRRYRLPVAEEDQVFRTLGRVSLLGKQAHVVKFGDRLLVLAKTANGLEKLTELTNPQEIERVVGLCHGGSSVQVARSVREMLDSEAVSNF